MRPPAPWGPSLLLAAVLGVGSPGAPGLSQTADPLDRVEALLAQGKVEAARSALLAWWDSAFPGASRFRQQRGLWLRGLLTVDPEVAARDFRRLVVEYPGGAFSDQALFRLALWAEMQGDTAQAAAHLRSLLLEYPTSSLVPAARERLEGKGAPLHGSGGGRAGEGQPSPGPPPGGRGAADASPLVPPASAGGAGEALVRVAYGVQLGAYRSAEAARAMMDRLRRSGYEPRLVRIPGSDLLRVRVGDLASEEEARTLLRELKAKGFEALLVSDVAQEERAR